MSDMFASNQRITEGPAPRGANAGTASGLGAALAMTLATVAAATPYGFSSGVEVVGAGYDHVSTSEPASHFFSQSLAPLIQYRGDTPALRLHLFARRGFTAYRGARVDSIVRGGVQTLDNASFSVVRPGPQLDPLSLQGTYARSRDALDLSERVLTNQADVTHWTARGSAALPYAEGSVDAHGWHYSDSDLTRAIAVESRAKVVPLRGSFTSLFGDWNDRVMMLGRTVAMHAWLAGGGVRRQVNPWFWLELEGGISHVAWSDGRAASGPGGRLAVQTRRDVPEIVVLEVEARRGLPTSFGGELGYRLAAGSVRLRGAWEPDVEGGTLAGPQLARRLTLAADDTLGRATLVGGEVGYARLTPLHFDGPQAETVHASGWVLRRVRTWLSARLGGAFVRQPVAALKDEPMFRRMRLDFALIALFPGEGAGPGAW